MCGRSCGDSRPSRDAGITRRPREPGIPLGVSPGNGTSVDVPLRKGGNRLEVRPPAPHRWSVFTTPTCSVPAAPSAEEALGYLKCVDGERADRSDRHSLDDYFLYEEPESLPRHLLTFEEDAGMWHLWTIFWNRCGNCHREARERGIIQRR